MEPIPRAPIGLATALLSLVVVAVAWSAPVLEQTGTAAPPAEPTITFVDEPTSEHRALVEWAVSRYVDAGLALPDLEVGFPASCGGKGARYFVGQRRMELCHVTAENAVHEMAHAWDDAGNVDRDAFMALRGVDHWYARQGERSVYSGGEQLAQIMTWGLLEEDTTVAYPAHAGQPIDEWVPELTGLPASTVEELTAAFEWLTGGVAPLHQAAPAARS